jgi:hypothetical protein
MAVDPVRPNRRRLGRGSGARIGRVFLNFYEKRKI